MRIELKTWAGLSRTERRALLQVYAGGSLRSASEPTINALRILDLISEEHEITLWGVNTLQAVARSEPPRHMAA